MRGDNAGRGWDDWDDPTTEPAPGDYSLPEPIPLRRNLPVPAFPDWLLPPVVGDMVRAVADYVQVPVGMAGTAALGAVSAIYGGYVEVQMDPDSDGYMEPVNLFVGSVAASADRKSSCQGQLTRPLQLLEQELIEQTRDQIAAAEAQLEIVTAQADRLRRKATREPLTAQEEQEAQQTAIALTGMPVTAAPSIIEDDITPEALGVAMHEQGGQSAVISAEGGLFDMMTGQYSRNPNLSPFLKGHAGDPWKVRRVGRARGGDVIRRPALTVSLMIQPKILAKAVRENENLTDAGVLARMVLDCSPSLVGTRKVRQRVPVPKAVRDRYTRLLMGAGRRFRLDPAQRVERTKTVLRLTLSDAARDRWLDFVDDVEVRIAPEGELAHIGSWAGKSTGLAGRLAGLLHMMTWRPGASCVITEAEMDAALGLVEYYTAHALVAFDVMSSAGKEMDLAQQILKNIARRGLKIVSTSIVMGKGHPAWMPAVREVEPALDLLARHHWLIELPTMDMEMIRRPGRPQAAQFEVHPDVLKPGFLDELD